VPVTSIDGGVRYHDVMATRVDSIAAVEAELVEERAFSLGRVARTLEAHLAELGRIDAELSAAPDDAGLRDAYAQTRLLAERYRWYLIVQREALGLRNHDLLERLYPLPPRLRESK
jgi:hypothetical protein